MNDNLRILVDLRDRVIQKNRIAFGLRLGAIERGSDSADKASTRSLERWEKWFADTEKELDSDIKEIAKEIPIINLVCDVKGVGFLTAAKLCSLIDIERADTISALWRFAGYAVIDGSREKPTKGEKLHYNSRLKAVCYNIACQFLKNNSPYRQIYDSSKAYYEANRLDWTKLRIHYASLRKMIKIFLSHLWLTWRELEGLPVREPYSQEKLGHTHLMHRTDFGWDEWKIKPKPSMKNQEDKETL